MTNPFQRIELFAQLSPSALTALDRLATPLRRADGELIMLQGERQTRVFFLLEGSARIFRTNPDGREQNLILLRQGAGLNLPTAFGPWDAAPASAMAVGDVTLLTIPLADFRRVSSETPEIALAVLGDMAAKLQHLTNLTHDLSLRSVRGRLAQFLLNQSSAESASPMRWTHEAIATHIGTVREVVSRTMRAFIKEGLIKIERQRIHILDLEGLQREAQF